MELTHWLPGLEDSIAAADCMLEQDGVVEVDLPTAVQLVSESPGRAARPVRSISVGRSLHLFRTAVGTAAARPRSRFGSS